MHEIFIIFRVKTKTLAKNEIFGKFSLINQTLHLWFYLFLKISFEVLLNVHMWLFYRFFRSRLSFENDLQDVSLIFIIQLLNMQITVK